MQHLTEVLKIIDGGLRHDPPKLRRYAELLASKLEQEGDEESASLLRRALSGVQARGIRPANPAAVVAVPVDPESRLTVGDLSYPTPEQVPLILPAESTAMIEEFIDTFRQRDRLLAAGLSGPGHLLLYGPPGCGKTQAARYVAAQLGLPLLTARLDGLISSFLGSTAKNIRAFFEFADRSPCILFLDEFDAIAKMRDDEHELGELKRVVNSLIQNIDLLPPGCSIIAATNHEHLLDPAVWRRFEYHVSISLPVQEARLRLLQLYGPIGLTPNVLQVLAVMTDGLSASDIQGVAAYLARQGVMNKGDASLRGAVSALLNYRKRFSSEGRTTPWARETNAVIRECRRLNSRIFTYDVIAEAFGLGRTKISQAIREPA